MAQSMSYSSCTVTHAGWACWAARSVVNAGEFWQACGDTKQKSRFLNQFLAFKCWGSKAPSSESHHPLGTQFSHTVKEIRIPYQWLQLSHRVGSQPRLHTRIIQQFSRCVRVPVCVYVWCVHELRTHSEHSTKPKDHTLRLPCRTQNLPNDIFTLLKE